ncbi:TorF family putative porin [Roseomonas sp. 18066]|uniref:TorF family putative porin n=1 Tax=Roseomonas sp. 18066 TaxID=2681412 RepID=UPI00135C40A2|nr:TorF family putative porin [Roseomonas sp. 18066]
MKSSLALASALSLSILPLALPAAAQTTIDSLATTVTVTPAVGTDYLFRGISQTRNRPAISLTLDAQHESGLYIGAFGSNVTFPGSNARQELDLLAGYRFEVAGVSIDLGGVYYTYPGYDAPTGGYDYNYFEAIAKASYTIDPVKVMATAAWSPNFYYESGSAFYAEGGADVTLPFGFTLAGRYGYQWIERNSRYGAPDYSNWSVAVSREVVGGFTLTVGYYDTDLSKSECFAGTKLCDSRAMATLSRAF